MIPLGSWFLDCLDPLDYQIYRQAGMDTSKLSGFSRLCQFLLTACHGPLNYLVPLDFKVTQNYLIPEDYQVPLAGSLNWFLPIRKYF